MFHSSAHNIILQDTPALLNSDSLGLLWQWHGIRQPQDRSSPGLPWGSTHLEGGDHVIGVILHAVIQAGRAVRPGALASPFRTVSTRRPAL